MECKISPQIMRRMIEATDKVASKVSPKSWSYEGLLLQVRTPKESNLSEKKQDVPKAKTRTHKVSFTKINIPVIYEDEEGGAR